VFVYERVYEILRNMEELTTKRLIVIILGMYYPLPLRTSHVYEEIRSIKPLSMGHVYRTMVELRIFGKVKRVKRGWHTLTMSGLKYLRWLWLKGYLPDELVNPAIHTVRVKEKIVRPDGTEEVILL